MPRNARARKKIYTGPLRLPQQTLPMARAPYSDVTGGCGEHDYRAQATYGKTTYYVEISGKPPTQRERDVLEMMFASVDPIVMAGGALGYRFEAYGFLRRLGYRHPGDRDVQWLREKLRRWIRPISLTATDGASYRDFAIVVEADALKVGEGRDARWLVAVVLSPRYVDMLRDCMHVAYPSLVPQIVELPSDLAKGIARHMLAHESRHRYLHELLGDLGIDSTRLTCRTLRRYRAHVVAAKDALSNIGIRVDVRADGLEGVLLHCEDPDGVYTARPARSPIATLLGLRRSDDTDRSQ